MGDLDRRRVLAAATTAPIALSAPAEAASAEAGARAALLAFLRAFENCDLPAMEAAFAPDATAFDRAPPEAHDLDLAQYRRAPGMPAGMRRVAQDLPKHAPGPPYQSLVPNDLLVQASGDMALCTFHLDQPHVLARRTVVLVRRSGAWKILHVHASNLAG